MPPEELSPGAFLLLFVITTAAALYQHRHALMVWLGLKEEK